jgi:D-3-phosphoglycerate dehydrogenase
VRICLEWQNRREQRAPLGILIKEGLQMPNTLKVYRVDSHGGRIPDVEEIEEIHRIGAELVSVDSGSEDETIAKAMAADAIITTGARISRRVLENLPNLQVVVRYGIGYDTIDVAAATENRVLVVNIPDYCFDEVSNHAIALFLACARKFPVLTGLTRRGQWADAGNRLPPMEPIAGQIFGLVGCGNIGRMVARKVSCFGVEIIGYDPYLDPKVAVSAGIDLLSLASVLTQSDYVSLHTPLTLETRHMIGEAELRMMKTTAYLINTSRGPVVHEEMLIKALRERWIAGAGLDVMEKEPPEIANPLLTMEEVVITPHAAYYSDDSVVRMRRSVGLETARVLSGKWPKNLVNKEVQPKRPLA